MPSPLGKALAREAASPRAEKDSLLGPTLHNPLLEKF